MINKISRTNWTRPIRFEVSAFGGAKQHFEKVSHIYREGNAVAEKLAAHVFIFNDSICVVRCSGYL